MRKIYECLLLNDGKLYKHFNKGKDVIKYFINNNYIKPNIVNIIILDDINLYKSMTTSYWESWTYDVVRYNHIQLCINNNSYKILKYICEYNTSYLNTHIDGVNFKKINIETFKIILPHLKSRNSLTKVLSVINNYLLCLKGRLNYL